MVSFFDHFLDYAVATAHFFSTRVAGVSNFFFFTIQLNSLDVISFNTFFSCSADKKINFIENNCLNNNYLSFITITLLAILFC